jgi:hypothetical protein
MDLWFLLILGIPLAVFILANLFRVPEERRQEGPRPARGPITPRSDPAGQPTTDLDRFLAEVQRRRQAGERQPASVPEPEPTASAERPRPPAPPAPPPARRRPRAPMPPPPRRQVVAVPVGPSALPPVPVTVEPAPALPAPPAPPPLPAAVVAAPVPAEPAAPPPPPPPPTAKRGRTLSAGLAQLAAMLNSPQSLRNAVLLREIFGEPLCRRGQR